MRHRINLFLAYTAVIISLTSCCFFHPPVVTDTEVAYLEDYLVDFSQKVQGYTLLNGPLPPDLDVPKFFSMLDQYYQNKEPIEKVKSYPVRVMAQDESYVLILCDKESKFIVYKDLGKTIDFVDYRYWQEQKQVPCSNN
jgi:hypothetical protein